MTDIRLPRLLGADMVEKARLRPDKVSVTLHMTPLSTASLTLSPDSPKAAVRDFLEIYGPYGSLGIFRVASTSTTYGDKLQVTAEHGIATLEDCLTGKDTTLTGNMRAMVSKLLSFQDKVMWALGDVEVSGTLPEMDVGVAGVLETLISVVALDETAMLAFDQSTLPWVLHIRKKPTVYACECRFNRNMSSINIKYDDADMCTRVTAEDFDGNLHTYSADTVGTWGVVHKAIMLGEGENPEKEAKKYLEEHKNPTLSIEIEALQLSQMTGEPMDKFTIGALCRSALPEWNAMMDERIMSMHYADIFGNPEQVRLTLSNQRRDASTSLAGLRSTTTHNSSAIRQNLKYYRELDDRVEIHAKEIELLGEDIKLRATWDGLADGLAEVDEKHMALHNEVSVELDAAKAELRLKASQEALNEVSHTLSEAMITLRGAEADIELLTQRTNKLTGEMTQAKLDINGAKATITAQAQALNAQGERISGAELRLNGLESNILLKADKTVTDGLDKRINSAELELDGAKAKISANASVLDSQGKEISAAKLRLDGLAGEIELKVSKDGIASAINMTNQKVLIQSNKIDLKGYVTADQLEVKIADIEDAWATSLRTVSISCDGITGGEADFDELACGGLYATELTVGGYDAEWQTVSVMTERPSLTPTTFHMTYKDANGINQVVDVVTGISFNRGTLRTINYLGR